MTTTVVPTTSLRPGQVTFFISARTLFHPSRNAVTHSRGLLTTAFSIRAPLMSVLGGVGRPRGTRTPNLRFWRPLLCQLSYWPAIAAKACKSTPLATYSPRVILSREDGEESRASRMRSFAPHGTQDDRRRCRRSLGLPVNRVLAVVTAELLQFQLLRHRLLVLGRRVVPTFALGALKGNDFSACARHVRSFKLVEPSTRFELVTPSLPRTCSTPELRGPMSSVSWSGRRDSNPRPTAWKAVTLPLSYSRDLGGERRIRTSVGQGPADLQSAAFDRSAISPEKAL